MMAPERRPPLRKAPLFTAREVWWTMLATVSVCYLAVHTFLPEWLDDLTPTNTRIVEQHNGQLQRPAVRQTDDIKALQSSVAQLQLDLAKVKTELAGGSGEARALAAKVSALEQRPATLAEGENAAAVPASTNNSSQSLAQSAPARVTPPAAEPALATVNAASELPAAAPVAATKIINAPAAAPISATAGTAPPGTAASGTKPLETGSLADPAPLDFGPAIVKRPAKPIGVQISSASSVENLRESWASLSTAHAATLQNMQPLYIAKGSANDPAFDLVAGPVKSRGEALKLCKSLAAEGVACKVGAFEGSAF